jgi:hypothetical protein
MKEPSETVARRCYLPAAPEEQEIVAPGQPGVEVSKNLPSPFVRERGRGEGFLSFIHLALQRPAAFLTCAAIVGLSRTSRHCSVKFQVSRFHGFR